MERFLVFLISNGFKDSQCFYAWEFYFRGLIHLYRLSNLLNYMFWKRTFLMSLMIYAFLLMLLSFWLLYLNEFWMIPFFKKNFFFLVYVQLLYLLGFLYWFSLCRFCFLLVLFCKKLHISVFMSCSRTSLIL